MGSTPSLAKAPQGCFLRTCPNLPCECFGLGRKKFIHLFHKLTFLHLLQMRKFSGSISPCRPSQIRPLPYFLHIPGSKSRPAPLSLSPVSSDSQILRPALPPHPCGCGPRHASPVWCLGLWAVELAVGSSLESPTYKLCDTG